LHSIPASQGRIAGYRIGEDQSGGIWQGAGTAELPPHHSQKREPLPRDAKLFVRIRVSHFERIGRAAGCPGLRGG